MSNYTKTTDFEAKDSLPTGDSGKIIRGAEFETEFDAISTAIATKADTAGPTFTGTLTFETISDGTIGVTAFVDEDDMSSDSATLVPTQQSVKAYVDSQVGANNELSEILANGNTTGGTNIVFGDSASVSDDRLVFGDGSDLQIYHSGVHSYIDDAGTGNLTLRGNASVRVEKYEGEILADFAADGAVSLYHDNSVKIATTSTGVNVTGNVAVSGTVDGRDVATDGTKLDGIEAGATADQTAAEIRTLVDSATDSNVFTDADHTKLDGIEANATADQTAAEIRTLVEAATDSNVFTDADHTKLDGIEAGADVTDTTNVTAAGAVMDSELTNETAVKSLNQGVATTDSPTFAGLTTTANVSFGDNDKAVFGAGSDLQIYHDGSHSYIKDNGTGNLRLQGATTVQITDPSFTSYSAQFNPTGAATLYYNNSAKLATTSTGIDVTGNATFGDNGKAIFGAGSDLQIYHDGSNSYVEDTGDGALFLKTNGAGVFLYSGSEALATFNLNGASNLYYDNGLKLSTTSTGIDVTGTVTADGLTVEGTGFAGMNIQAGASSLAAIDFGDSADTNIGGINYNNANDTLNLRAGNLNRLTVASNGDINFYEDTGTTAKLFWDASAERLGIGTTSPDSALMVTDGSNYTLRIGYLGTSQNYIDVDTHVFRSANATERMRIDSSGQVGINTTSNQFGEKLSVNGFTANVSGSVVGLTGANSDGSIFGSYSNHPALFRTNNTERMRIDASGNVGIGSTSPVTFGANTQGLTLNGTATGQHITWQTGGTSKAFAYISGNNFLIGSEATGGNTIFNSAGSERMRIDSSGNLLVNSTALNNWNNSAVKMRVDSGIQLGAYSAIAEDLLDADSLSLVSDSTENICFGQYNTTTQTYNENMRIDSSGNVGIGSTSPDSALVVQGGQGTYAQIKDGTVTTLLQARGQDSIGVTGTLSNHGFGFFTNSAERMRIDASGNLLVGKTNNTLSNDGTVIRTGGEILVTNTSDIVANFNRTGTDGSIVTYYKDGSTVGSIGASGGLLVIGDSDCGIAFEDGTTNHIYPWNVSGGAANDNAISLGSSSARFKDLYLSGNAYVGNAVTSSTDGSSDLKLEGNQHIFRRGSAGSYAEQARIDSSGNLLVGTTDAAPWDNTGSASGAALRADGRFSGAVVNGEVILLNRLATDGTIADFRKDGTSVGSIGTESGYLAVGSSHGQSGYLGFRSNMVYPSTSTGGNRDDIIDLGGSSQRFDDIYATNGTIQTSDRNEKQDIEALSDAEQRVAVACKGLLRKFRWKSSVAENGDDARIHFGIIAQDLQAAFEAEGLDAGRYAMFISTTWTDEESGEERTRMGVRYSELLSFIIAAI